jgi:hypothetical protein
MSTRARLEYGDFQTPDPLADRVLAFAARRLTPPPRTVLEPTCGDGSFLVAAARHFPDAILHGYEIDARHVETAASRIRGNIVRADFFSVDWDREVAGMEAPILVAGNPPWVTSASLGALGSANLPRKENFKRLPGLDALTGKSNFDVSEWMILRLLAALAGREAALAVLCKAAVARRVVEHAARQRWPVRPGAIVRIDAARHFGAAVDAVLFLAHLAPGATEEAAAWPVYASLDADAPEAALGVAGGELVADLEAHARSRVLAGRSDPAWRSGIKHDCARVMELARRGGAWVNGAGEAVDVEPDACFPLLKSADVARGRLVPGRAVIVTQRTLGGDTAVLRDCAPRLWAYLDAHRAALDARRSAVYRGRPPFAMFGVGDYAFAPWKVAVSGLHKRLRFAVVGPHEGRPVMLDDTCYFLPFADEAGARRAAAALGSDLAADFFRARVFWDAKRPITKTVLQALDLDRLARALGGDDAAAGPCLRAPGVARSPAC